MNYLIKTTFLLLLLPLLITSAYSGRISDFVYEDSENNIVVANRQATKKIALTFDDGPSEKYTWEILEILKENNAHATFFIIGQNAEKYPDLLKAEIDAGHEIANHTYSHPDLRNISIEKLKKEISLTNEVIERITGMKPKYFRPPGGYLNNNIVKTITESNSVPVLWSWRQDTMDWKNPTSETIVNNVIKNLKDGDIVLFHDYNSGNSPTPNALRILLPKLREFGYEFVTISELTSSN